MESLDENLFFLTLMNTFKKRYQDVIDNCYHLCVPVNGSYDPKQLDDKFITSHILKPSPLLKSHFLPYNNKQNFQVQIDGREIKVTKGFGDQNHRIIKILNEEHAYNNSNQRYSIFICEKPLISSLNCKLNYESLDTSSKDIELVSFEDCEKFLQGISKQELEKLKNEINQLIKTYIILPDYISGVAMKLKKIIDIFIGLFSSKISNNKIKSTRNSKELLCSTVESYSIGLIYNQLITLIKKKMFKEDEIFLRKVCFISNYHLKPTDFGAQKVFEKFSITDCIRNKLQELETLTTPLCKLNCMRQTLDLINDQLKKTVDDHKSPFDNHRTEKIYIMSDDLIAAVICVLAVCKPNSFCSTIEFIHTFSWYLPQNSELGYSLVTFEVAKEYIVNYNNSNSNDINGSIFDMNKSKQVLSKNMPNIQQNTPKINHLNSEFSSLDHEIDKMTKFIGDSALIYDDQSSSLQQQQSNTEEELGGFLGSLAGDFMTKSGQKY